MKPSQPDKLIGPTNELAKERNRAASERTLISWIQNCLTLIGFGFAIDQIFLALEKKFPDNNLFMTSELTHNISLLLIALSIILLIIAMVQHYFEVDPITGDDYFSGSSSPLNIVVVSAIIIFGSVSMSIAILRL